jgi:SAM-dependent methyltransferase
MSDKQDFMEHWLNINTERLARYETMYQWSSAAEAFYAPAVIRTGHVVADFGCGPGHTAIEFAHRVGPSGHVHALDINTEFINRTRARAQAAGLALRITARSDHDREVAATRHDSRSCNRTQDHYLRSRSHCYIPGVPACAQARRNRARDRERLEASRQWNRWEMTGGQ